MARSADSESNSGSEVSNSDYTFDEMIDMSKKLLKKTNKVTCLNISLKSELEQLKHDNMRLTSANTELSKTSSFNGSLVQELEDQIDTLEAKIDTLESENETLKSESITLKGEIITLTSENTTLKSDNTTLQESVKRLEIQSTQYVLNFKSPKDKTGLGYVDKRGEAKKKDTVFVSSTSGTVYKPKTVPKVSNVPPVHKAYTYDTSQNSFNVHTRNHVPRNAYTSHKHAYVHPRDHAHAHSRNHVKTKNHAFMYTRNIHQKHASHSVLHDYNDDFDMFDPYASRPKIKIRKIWVPKSLLHV